MTVLRPIIILTALGVALSGNAQEINFKDLKRPGKTLSKSYAIKGVGKDAGQYLSHFTDVDGSRVAAKNATRSGGSSTGNRNTCFMIRDDDERNACLAQFDGKNTCFMIKDDDERNACLAQFDGKNTCFMVRDKDMMNACLAQFDGKNTCFMVRNKDMMNACLAQFDGKNTCFMVKDQDMMNGCLAQFQ